MTEATSAIRASARELRDYFGRALTLRVRDSPCGYTLKTVSPSTSRTMKITRKM